MVGGGPEKERIGKDDCNVLIDVFLCVWLLLFFFAGNL